MIMLITFGTSPWFLIVSMTGAFVSWRHSKKNFLSFDPPRALPIEFLEEF
jgi:hypothetical protein